MKIIKFEILGFHTVSFYFIFPSEDWKCCDRSFLIISCNLISGNNVNKFLFNYFIIYSPYNRPSPRNVGAKFKLATNSFFMNCYFSSNPPQCCGSSRKSKTILKLKTCLHCQQDTRSLSVILSINQNPKYFCLYIFFNARY